MSGFAERWGRLGSWRRWVAGGARGRTLEVGVGTGRNLVLYEQVEIVVAIEPALAPLLAARRRSGGARLAVATAEALPFGAGRFDTVVSSLVFCSVDDVPAGFAEVARVLAPGGTLRMLEHVRSRRAWRARLQDLVQPAWTAVAGGCRPNRDTRASLEAAGFRVEERRASDVMRQWVAHPPSGEAQLPGGTAADQAAVSAASKSSVKIEDGLTKR